MRRSETAFPPVSPFGTSVVRSSFYTGADNLHRPCPVRRSEDARTDISASFAQLLEVVFHAE
jgi:hypothetical protein